MDFTVFASGNHFIDFSFGGKLLATYTNSSHEHHFLRFAAHLRENSQMSKTFGVNGYGIV